MSSKVLDRDFYLRSPQEVARDLLGKILVSQVHHRPVSGIICETEAYDGEVDQACHARTGKTRRNSVMYGMGGFAYVYFTYGMHWMFNCVVGERNYPAAVLIRAIQPLEGLDIIYDIRSPIGEKHWCDGPAKLTKSLGITAEHNGIDLCNPKSAVYLQPGSDIGEEKVIITPRVGIDSTPEPWKSKPWRFLADLC